MKILNLLLLIAILSIYSCQDENEEIEFIDNTQVKIDERQVRLSGWTPPSCATISVFVSENCGPNYTQGVQDAMVAYNETNTSINMVAAPDENSADIVVDCVDRDLGLHVGIGQLPTEDEEVGGPIELQNVFENACDDPCWYQANLMNLFGRTLGIGPNGVYSGTNSSSQTITFDHIANTDSRGGDISSVFNNSLADCDNPDCTFSEDDIIALETVYPLPEPCDCPEAYPPHACSDWESQIIESQCPCPPGFKCVGGKKCVEL